MGWPPPAPLPRETLIPIAVAADRPVGGHPLPSAPPAQNSIPSTPSISDREDNSHSGRRPRTRYRGHGPYYCNLMNLLVAQGIAREIIGQRRGRRYACDRCLAILGEGAGTP